MESVNTLIKRSTHVPLALYNASFAFICYPPIVLSMDFVGNLFRIKG